MTTLKVDLGASGTGKVLVDGQDVSNAIRGVTIRAAVGEMTTAELDVIAPAGITFDGPARITITPEVRAIMLAAGWTPPTDDGACPVLSPLLTGPCERKAGHEGAHENYEHAWRDQ